MGGDITCQWLWCVCCVCVSCMCFVCVCELYMRIMTCDDVK